MIPTTLLSTTVLSSPGTFNIPIAQNTFHDLIIRSQCRGTNAQDEEVGLATFNSDGGANYNPQDVHGAGTSATADDVASAVWVFPITYMPSSSGVAGVWGAGTFTVYSYAATDRFKTLSGLALRVKDPAAAGNLNMAITSGVWASTAAITSIQIFGFNVTNLATGSTVWVYGVN